MDPDSTSQLIAIGCFLALSAFFSASETALTSINRIRLKSMVEQKVKGADTVEKVIESPDKLLSSILVGNNAANVSISSLSTALIISVFKGNSAAISIGAVIVTIVILIFSEITPKTVAANHPEKISLLVAKPIKLLITLLTPIVVILGFITGVLVKAFGGKRDNAVTVTETEIKTMVDVSHKEGIIETDEKIMINNVFEFGDNTAKDIMTPRTDIVSISSEASYEDIMETFKSERFSRVLVYEDDVDHIIGILFFKDFIFCDMSSDNFNIQKILRPAFFSYENKPISRLFSEMRVQGIPIAVILDEYSGTSGIVTIEDLVEEIVGDISDEDDEEDEDFEVVTDDEYLVDGGMKIDDFNDMAGSEFESPDYESIGGFVLGQFGHIPKEGEKLVYGNYSFLVEKMDKNRIDTLRVTFDVPESEVTE